MLSCLAVQLVFPVRPHRDVCKSHFLTAGLLACWAADLLRYRASKMLGFLFKLSCQLKFFNIILRGKLHSSGISLNQVYNFP